MRYLKRHDEELLCALRYNDPDDDWRKAVGEDLLADFLAEYGVTDSYADLPKETPLIGVPLVGRRIMPQIGRQIEQRLIFRVGRVQLDGVICQKGTSGIGQSPAPMVRVHELGNFQAEGHNRRSPDKFLFFNHTSKLNNLQSR
jgi:hypothetical protein